MGGMFRPLLLHLALLALLAGCSGLPIAPREPSACDAGEATHDCQVERYRNVNA